MVAIFPILSWSDCSAVTLGNSFGLTIGILVAAWLLVLICVATYEMVRVLERRRQRIEGESRSGGFPVVVGPLSNDGPGTYLIVGVDSATSKDVRTYIEAETLANAKVKAELRGVIVTDIVRQ
jgi:hypothetical protein